MHVALESCFFLLFFASTRRSADHPMALHRRSIWHFSPFLLSPFSANSPIFASKMLGFIQKTWTFSCLIHGDHQAIGRSQKRCFRSWGATRDLPTHHLLAGQRPLGEPGKGVPPKNVSSSCPKKGGYRSTSNGRRCLKRWVICW